MKGLLSAVMLLPCFFYARKSAAQDSVSHFSIVISSAVFIPVTVAIQGGLQVNVDGRVSLLIEGAIPTFYPKNTEYEKIEYWRSGFEVKYRINKNSSLKKYIALQSKYLFRQLTDKDQGFFYTKTQTFSYQGAVIKSPVLSPALKLGIEMPAGKKTFFDAFIGLGLRFIFTKYESDKILVTSTEPPKQSFFDFDDAWLYNYTLKRLYGTAGLRFGIRL